MRAVMRAEPSPWRYAPPLCSSGKPLENLPDAFVTRAVNPAVAGSATCTPPLAMVVSMVRGHRPSHAIHALPDAACTATLSSKRPEADTCPLATSTLSACAATC